MEKTERKFFIGIDLGGKEKKTTGVCIITKDKCIKGEENKFSSSPFAVAWECEDVFGKDILKVINPYLKNTEAIAIDAPLTKGRGKGKFRLYEKFLSTSIFRRAKVNPIPPALMEDFCDFTRDIVKKLEKKGFVLDINLIETFPTFIKKTSKEILFPVNCSCRTENQKSALICAQTAFFHSQFKTRYLGYKDGFLFLPEISFWKEVWKKKFYQAWNNRSLLKYHRLITNIFK